MAASAAAALQCLFHFVLIHGAGHGAWAWYRVEDQIQKAGCKVSSMDMTGAGINLADPDTITTWEEYHKPALDFFASLPKSAPHEKVVLVGHSLGGFANLMLMERFPRKIDLAVFVSAVITPSGVSLAQDVPLLTLLANDDVVYHYQNGTPTSGSYPTSILHRLFYNGLDSEITVLASKLVRPYPNRMLSTPITYTKKNHGRVPAVYIGYVQDHAVPPAAQEYIVTHSGPLSEVVHLDGGHFNFLQRPKNFTRLLTRLAKKYSTP